MNIFVLDENPEVAARSLCDKHVVKMALESVQLLCTTAHKLGQPAPYKATHAKHPCSLWLLAGRNNAQWLFSHTDAIFDEYERRYEKLHASKLALQQLDRPALLAALPDGATPFAQAMPDEYKCDDSVQAYRAYYLGHKRSFATWKPPSAPPSWWR